ncbi:FecCD family ABC transporter permease [Pimelobacter simplex]|uniref:FecCD family ABC transporter permease n=1 Tax=Nocardioides simplex TaxID=2045 RepID=UPI00366DC150
MSGAPQVEFGYRRHRIGGERLNAVLRTRSLLVGAVVLLALGALGVLALMTGDYSLSAREVLDVLRGVREGLAPTVVLEWRLPRVLAAVVLGAALAVAGALFQTLTRNPLASPDIIGLSSGAFTGMLLTVLLVGTTWLQVTVGSVAGGAAAAAVIYLLAYRGGIQGFRFIVVGIAISSMLASANTWMLLQIEVETAMFASAWGAGSLNGVTGSQVLGAGLCVAVLLAGCVALAPALRQLDLGDDAAHALGLRPGRVKAAAVLLGVALVSVATAVVGPVAFISLAAPQIARRAAGTPYLPLTLTGLTGALLLLMSDFTAQHLLPVTLPAGVVTVVLGGAFLVWLIVREMRRWR